MINLDGIVKKQERVWEETRTFQVMDKDDFFYGTLDFTYNDFLVELIIQGLPLYANPKSRYYLDNDILNRMDLCVDFLLRVQLESGLISLWNCNIDSPPDTAFSINYLGICYFYIEKTNIKELEPLKQKIRIFLQKTISAMETGGFHTANHRWVISSALGMLYKIFGGEALKNRVFEFLAEGFDINASGEWSERSNVIYNAVSDLYVYHIGEIFGVSEAFMVIKRNLDMMKYLFHPDYYIATEYSTRQDRGTRARMDFRYTIVYLLMAVMYDEPEFVFLAEKALEYAPNFGMVLIYTALYEEKMLPEIEPKEISDSYTVLLNEKGIAEVPKKFSLFSDPILRYRSNKLSITIMAGQPEFMFLQYGSARAFGIKLPIGWFGMGGVCFPKIECIDNKNYRMITKVTGKYWQALPEETVARYVGDFVKMPNNLREDINKVETEIEVKIRLYDDGMELNISTPGLPMLFTQLVIMLDKSGSVTNAVKLDEHVLKLERGKAVYESEGDRIEITGESSGHKLPLIRGDILNEKAQNLVLNATSPKNWKISFKCT